jgi:hypothetical protein
VHSNSDSLKGTMGLWTRRNAGPNQLFHTNRSTWNIMNKRCHEQPLVSFVS